MSVFRNSSSPINVSSRVSSSPQAIIISSDTSSARESDVLYSQAHRWPTANHRVATEDHGLGSRASSIFLARVSNASVSSVNFPYKLELAQLRNQCAELQSENQELQGRYDSLRSVYISSGNYANTTDDIYRTAYKYLVDKLASRIDRTRSDMKKLTVNIGPSPTGPSCTAKDTEPTPTGSSPTRSSHAAEDTKPTPDTGTIIPQSPQREHYLLVRHWEQDSYNTIRHPKKGTPTNKTDDPLTCLFMEDEFGKVVSPAIRRRVSKDIKAFWQEQYKKGKGSQLNSLTHIGRDMRDEFCAAMEESCQGHSTLNALSVL